MYSRFMIGLSVLLTVLGAVLNNYGIFIIAAVVSLHAIYWLIDEKKS